MAFLGIDLGGTKLSLAVFNVEGGIIRTNKVLLEGRKGRDVGLLIAREIKDCLTLNDGEPFEAIGVSVPGISRSKSGTVWAPNIPGWTDYPLLSELEDVVGDIPIRIDSDRACYILGEVWQGNAKGVRDAIFLAVGTGIGAGILINGTVLRGAHDIAGAIGWMALDCPFKPHYAGCGFFEYHASGDGIARVARDMMMASPDYTGVLRRSASEKITAVDVFEAYQNNDPIAITVLDQCVLYWGMAAANLISLFNPEKIIFGGGVFGPAVSFIPSIQLEAEKWAQPISATQVRFEPSALGEKAGVYGAGFLALQSVLPQYVNHKYA